MAAGATHASFDTTDPAVANALFRELYPRSQMVATPSSEPFRYREDVHSVPDYSIAHLRFEGRMIGDNVFADRVAVIRIRSGRLDWEVRGQHGAAPGLVLLQPGDRLAAGWGPLDAVMLSLDMTALRRAAAVLYGLDIGPISFDGQLTTSERFEQSVTTLVDVALTIAESPAFDNAIVRSSLYRSLVAAVLDGFASVGDREARRVSVVGLATIYRRARSYMDEHASLPVTVEDVAAAVGVPGTELDRAFAVLGATTPTAYLGWARMSSANSDLQASSGSIDTARPEGAAQASDFVREVALRWGFPQPRRFARLYRRQYGVGPADVLGI